MTWPPGERGCPPAKQSSLSDRSFHQPQTRHGRSSLHRGWRKLLLAQTHRVWVAAEAWFSQFDLIPWPLKCESNWLIEKRTGENSKVEILRWIVCDYKFFNELINHLSRAS